MIRGKSLSFHKSKRKNTLKKINSAPSILKNKKSITPPRTVMRSVTYVNRPFHENLTKFNKEYLDYLIQNKKLKEVPKIPINKPSALPLFGSYESVSPSRNILNAKKLAEPGFLAKKVPLKVLKEESSLEDLTHSFLLDQGVTPSQLKTANYPNSIVDNMSQVAYKNKKIGVKELQEGKRNLRVPVRRSRNISNYENMINRGHTDWRQQSNYIGIVPKGKWHRLHIPSTRFVKSKKYLKFPTKRLIKSDRTSKEDRKSLRKKRNYHSGPKSI